MRILIKMNNAFILTFILCILKICGFFPFSWWWAISPIVLWPVFLILFASVMMIIMIIINIISGNKDYLK